MRTFSNEYCTALVSELKASDLYADWERQIPHLVGSYHIDSLDTDPLFRKNGFASMVLAEICSWADKEGHWLSLIPASDDDGAELWLPQFYSKFGFEPVPPDNTYMLRSPHRE